MAGVVMTYTWPTGEQLEVAAEVEESYPDSANEARQQAVAAFREACEMLVLDPSPGPP